VAEEWSDFTRVIGYVMELTNVMTSIALSGDVERPILVLGEDLTDEHLQEEMHVVSSNE